MLFYAAFWPALAALTQGRWRAVFKLVSAGVVVVVILQVLQVIVGPATRLFLIASSDSPHHSRRTRRVPAGAPTWTHDGLHRRRFRPRPRSLGAASRQAARLGDGGGGANRCDPEPQPKHAAGAGVGALRRGVDRPQKHRFVVMVATLGMVLSGLLCSPRAPPWSRIRSCRASQASPTTRGLKRRLSTTAITRTTLPFRESKSIPSAG